MFAFKNVFASVFLAVLCASTASAGPFPAHSKFATHRSRELTRDFKLETYHPESSYETFGAGVDHPLSKRADASIEDSAVAFVQSRIKGLAADAVTVKSSHTTDAASHVYVKQTLAGIPFANAVANVAFNKEKKVVAFGSSFVDIPSSMAKISTEPSVTAAGAIASAEDTLAGTFDAEEFPDPALEWVAKDDGSAVLTHVFQVRNEEAGTWYEAFVDAHSGELVSVIDFVTKASYRVLPITKEVLTEGFEVVTNPQDTSASPNGWHTGTDTQGNNVISYKSSQSSTTSQSASDLLFDYPVDTSAQPTTTGNVNAARVNTFYVVNTVHDVTYKYGFTESAYNFQADNFDEGGKGGDRVTVSVQDSAGTNNADFSTPPDGQPGAMRMFTWTYTSPRRDGALENDIVIHEDTHGVTNRMTGGGTGRCLQSTEAAGMGEGWSDAMADWFHKTSSSVPDFVMGQYVINDGAGIRNYPYSTSAVRNPLTYASIKTLNEVHNIGEIWANLLHNVYGALVDALGFSAAAHTDPSGGAGNVVFLHLFVDALALQRCNPTFVSARDAWIQADANRFGGANTCTLWKAFASKGLGVKAAKYNDDSTLPSDC
ncbi:Fungalysin metallopeptidase-domain-containing protein [Epithele typhae]|uniref:Fungalysin metallopeptidase-domain-containing protein n=1 Tax=Epithele typhae TaxID=378194 RepID=UPI002008088B|nr:Fungalysin metallopeptidase-domain-containing protein [Epithele typhae]KAH9912689.1 Fungalysin metallopeptidase-domain-containing protein [Epithele typhae]